MTIRRPSPTFLIHTILALAVVIVFFQVGGHEFLNFDDNLYVTHNMHVRAGLTSEGIAWAFSDRSTGTWHPLTWLSLMLDSELYGAHPRGFHFTNLFFHLANTLLLFSVLLRLTGARLRSAFVAALFAIHPLHVESVAWVAERKDVLSTFFWLSTLWAYARYVEHSLRRWFFLALFFFALGLLAKPMLVTLPFVLLLLDFWPLHRFRIAEKIPFFLLALGSSILTFLTQGVIGAVMSTDVIPFWTRMANAAVSYVRYIGKTIWPENLAAYYPFDLDLPSWEVAGSLVFIFCVSAFAVHRIRKMPWLAVGWFWYLGTLVPVIGFVQVGTQSMADRYSYIPLVGLFIMLAWSIPDREFAHWFTKKQQRFAFFGGVSGLLAVLMVASWYQTGYWQNDISLLEHTIEVTRDNALAQENLGAALAEKGHIEDAITHYQESLRIHPDNVEPHIDLGNAFASQGKIQEAVAQYAEALRINPSSAAAHNDLGLVLAGQGHLDEAIAHYTEALKIDPNYSDAHNNYGIALAKTGKIQEAIGHYLIALNLNPDNSGAQNNLGAVLAGLGKNQEAIEHFSEALKLDPNSSVARENLANALATQRKNSGQ